MNICIVSSDDSNEDEFESLVVKGAIPIASNTEPSTSRNRKKIPLWEHISGDDTTRPMAGTD